MIFLRSAFVAGLATIGQAIVLPSSVSPADVEIFSTLPIEAESGAEHRTLDLECKDCPVPMQLPKGLKWVYDVESKLQFQFDIAKDEVDTLQLNGVQIYPPHRLPLEPVGAPQTTEESSFNNETAFLRLGYELLVKPVMKSEDGQLELIFVRLQVIEIAGIFVDGLESVLLKLLKTPDGRLKIRDLETGPTTNPGGKDCRTLICKLKSILTGKLSQTKPKKGCGSKEAPAIATPHGHATEHGAHRHNVHYGLPRIFRSLKKAAFHVIIPILVGIAAGFTASVLGMFVGQSAVFFWRTFYRRGCNGPYSRVDRNDTATEGKYHKKLLVENQDLPPVYEDVFEDVKSAE